MANVPSGTVPVLVLREGTGRTTGRDAQRNNIMAAKAIAATVKSTLGPRGMDKMLVSGGDVTITNDGATILKELDVQHPAAKMLVEVAKTMDNEVGDGTTTAAVLAGELLAKAEHLLDQNVHPTVIIDGYKKAGDKAQEIVNSIAMPVSIKDDELLCNVALTSMGSKGITAAKEHFAKLAVEAVKLVTEEIGGKLKADIGMVKVIKEQGKSLEETELVRGMVIEKQVGSLAMPRRMENAKIALLTAKLQIEKTEFEAKINIDSPEQMKQFLNEEERILKEMAKQISKTGANVVLSQATIDELALHFLNMKNILAVKSVPMGDLEKIAKATGGKIVTSLKDLTPSTLGEAKTVEEAKIGDNWLIYIRDCKNPKAVTIVIRGGSEHVVAEAERSLHDALCVVRNAIEDGKIVAGGGAPEAEISRQLRNYAVKVGGREQLAIEAFADAVDTIPMTLAENAGLDPIDIMVALRAEHERSNSPYLGIDVFDGKIKNMLDLNIVEPLRVKQQVIKSATEAANMILKIDDLISAKGTGKEAAGPKRPQ